MTSCNHDEPDPKPDEAVDDVATQLMRAVFRHLGAIDSIDPKVGGKFMGLAFRGLSVREHFDAHHPEQIERGAEMAPPEAADREAWLFGYRFVDRKEGA